MIQLVPSQDNEQVHRLRDYSFSNKYIGEKRNDFQYWVEYSTTIGAYDERKLVGQLLVLPLNMTIHQTSYKMGGIGFVCTYPEFRNRGIMKKLMIRALEEMRKNGQSVSVLAPFSVSFYRYFGWELFFDKLNYSIPSEAFPNFGNELDDVKRFSFEWLEEQLFEDVCTFYNDIAKNMNGFMKRDGAWWKRIHRREPDSHFAAYYKDDKIQGFVRYQIQNLTFIIKDFVVKDYLAEQALWRYISSHSASVYRITGNTAATNHFGFHFNQPQFKKELVQDCMVRIVDVTAFLSEYSWAELTEPMYLRIQDHFAHWNEQLYCITNNGDVEIVESDLIVDDKVLSLSINIFSAMIVGYLTVSEAALYAKHQPHEATLMAWEQALRKEKPSFYEYF
ncbi:GNAT family N-acetyltransferase [Viridibacillus sp. YIM B01967]|uniref:GNAT family N-acetyltransferase n=1 Tax=Viridibacillus soli TaxID=2798301 RepID=A0ABS1H1W6_9BACL|nr:GNAT family N-acetyltransferase [Viridibacillus soli]MBK3493393.1 GNAT family N-acetyltransferase [Viridibacillus soli]